jgi:hypothetical protein
VDAQPAPTVARDERWSRPPFGILVVVVLRVLEAVGIAAAATGLREMVVDLPEPLSDSPVILVVGLVWAGAALLGAVGLLLGRSWGWVLTMVMVGVGLAFTLFRIVIGLPDYVELLLLRSRPSTQPALGARWLAATGAS